jgi:5-methylcytosine-specific restriction protein B
MNDSHPTDWFVIRKQKAVAYGRPVPNGFLVRAESTAMRDGSPNKKRDRSERDRLINSGVLVEDIDPDILRFVRDHVFSSRSQAGGVVIDGNSNGNHWKREATNEHSPDEVPELSRAAVEEAIDEYDTLGEEGFRAAYPQFGDPHDYWLRSSRPRQNGPYPTKPIVALALGLEQLNGGWSTRDSATSLLHNAGFVIVGRDDSPVAVPEEKPHLIKGADRIRACAITYYIAPARERGDRSVTITAGRLHDEIGLSKAWANVCQALRGPIFQELAGVPKPHQGGPDASTTTTFTYHLGQRATEMSLSSATNLILYGPPGTGKTFATAAEAVRLCLGLEASDPLFASDRRSDLMKAYRELAAAGRIEFITFHQSFSYEEFVEGLRPTTDAAEVLADQQEEEISSPDAASAGFRLQSRDGIFKLICERTRLDTGDQPTGKRLDRQRSIFKIALGRREDQEDRIHEGLDNNLIHLGWGGDIDWSDERFDSFEEIRREWNEKKNPSASGKNPNIEMTYSFRSFMQVDDYVVLSDGRDSYRAFGRVTGEYFYDADAPYHPHRRHVEWIWQDAQGIDRNQFYKNNFRRQSVYRLQPAIIDWDALEEIILGTDSSRPSAGARPYVLVIDEINRANISKVFGELITLLEPDKRLGEINELKVKLPYSGTPFGVPANLHIIGTMNTADRSIALLDTALRRRFEFRELMPEPRLLAPVDGINLETLLSTINARIEYLFDREHQIGHAYFINCTSRDGVEDVMRYKVIPLLAEYFYEDWGKVAAVLGDADESEGDRQGGFLDRTKLPAPKGMGSEGDVSSRFRWTVRDKFDFSGLLHG